MNKRGFTLIELSIVLVIIGLIVGGVLVGQDLISAATIRAQISQIEKYQAAVNTFRSKYGYLPGDMPNPPAGQFGFIARGTNPGEGDGTGVLEGVFNTNGGEFGDQQSYGETVTFWADLSYAGLISGSFTKASETVYPGSITTTTNPSLSDLFPSAKIGQGSFVYAWSGGIGGDQCRTASGNCKNYYGITFITDVSGTLVGAFDAKPGITVVQAYNIDQKTDDGYPQSGRVQAMYINAGGGGLWVGDAPGSVTAASATTCYDNGGNGGTEKYSIGKNSGTGINCSLSVQFQ